jgi:dihydrofolate reductase
MTAAADPSQRAGETDRRGGSRAAPPAFAQPMPVGDVAGDKGVDIAGGASTVRQALIAGVIDELTLDIAPVLLGSGERIFDGVESFGFEPAEVLHSPLTTHIRYRRVS